MAKVTYIEASGVSREADVAAGESVMEGALATGVEGIAAVCGGACACATCHVYVDSAWTSRLPPLEDMEEAMLDFAENVEPTSRLSCQITMSADLDGLIVRVPPIVT